MASGPPIQIIYNACSGSRDARAELQTVASLLKLSQRRHEILVVEDPSEIAALARSAVDRAREQHGILAVAGGDGTVNTVAHAALDADLPFGVLPQGTFNYFSRSHGIPLDTPEAVRTLLTGAERPAQVGLVNDRPFLVSASLGLYPRVIEDREAYKRRYGRKRLVALWSAVTTLLREHRQITMQVEHGGTMEIMHTSTLFVGNNALQLAQIGLPEASDVESGHLAAIMVRPSGMFSMLGLLLRGALGELGDSAHLRRFSFRQMTVRPWLPYGRRRMRVAIDGEVHILTTPLSFRVSPRALRLLVPRGDSH